MKKKEEKIYYYEIEYASGILRSNGRSNQYICSHKKLKEEQFIIVEHIDCGVFIGRVVKEIPESFSDCMEYRYLKNIDLSEWIEEIDRQKRREELEREMQSRFAELDKKKKYEYYAEFDDSFRELYLEYEGLK